jgi:hypothetical protein
VREEIAKTVFLALDTQRRNSERETSEDPGSSPTSTPRDASRATKTNSQPVAQKAFAAGKPVVCATCSTGTNSLHDFVYSFHTEELPRLLAEGLAMEKTKRRSLNTNLKPLCPRDSHVMRYEKSGIRWTDDLGVTLSVPSYHCDFHGCSVRYEATDGYFSVVDEPVVPFFLEEPGANILRCPQHEAWLYRSRDQADGNEYLWRCPVEGCTYTRAGISGVWLRE